jgi:hypothetical protein
MLEASKRPFADLVFSDPELTGVREMVRRVGMVKDLSERSRKPVVATTTVVVGSAGPVFTLMSGVAAIAFAVSLGQSIPS